MEKLLSKNEATIARAIRVVLGLVLLSLTVIGPHALGPGGPRAPRHGLYGELPTNKLSSCRAQPSGEAGGGVADQVSRWMLR